MRRSPAGVVEVVRPQLGRIRRGLVRRRVAWSPSGAPTPDIDRPDAATSATGSFLAGCALQRGGQSERALVMFAHSLAQDARFERRWVRYARLLASVGRTTDAIEAFRAAHESDPGSPTPLLAIASLQLGLDVQLDDAAVTATAIDRLAVERGPTDAQFEYLLALVRSHRGDAEGARSSFRSALADNGNDQRSERLLEYARFEAAQNRWRDAAVAYRQATAGDDHAEADLTPDQLTAALDAAMPTDTPTEWATVATAARVLLDDEPGNADARRALGCALFGLRQWSEAVDVLTIAADSHPSDLHLLRHLARAASNAGQHDRSVEARRRAVVLSPTGRQYQSLAMTLEEAGRFEEAVAAFEQAILLGYPSLEAIRQIGSAQRRSGSWAGAALLYRWALERHPDDGFLWYCLARSLEEVGEFDESLESYRRALRIEPDNAHWWFRLGYLHERYGPMRTEVLPWTGLQQRPAGDLQSSVESYRHAIALDPTVVGYAKRLAGVLEQLGELDDARVAIDEAVELAPSDASTWHLLGRVIAAKANQRGMYHPDEHDELERVWGEAVRLAPRRSGSRQQLTRASIKAARWPLADELAWYPAPVSTEPSAERILRAYLVDDSPSSDEIGEVLGQATGDLLWVPREWWFPLHWKLIAGGEFTLAYRAKELMARRTLRDGPVAPDENLSGHLEHARSLSYVGRNEDALAALTASLTDTMPEQTRRALDRHAADVALLLGDPQPHLEIMPTGLDEHVRMAEQSFDDLIRGRRVAIVGPGQSDLAHGGEIDGHDVVIRTKFVDELDAASTTMAGARTDVSYYALSSAHFLRSDIVDALRSEALKMAVFRTAAYRPNPTHLVTPGDLRYVPSEFVAGLRATQFAIQRIFYDVLRYSPASIKIFNIDFFLSPDAYRPGYNGALDVQAKERGYIKILGAYGHDFLSDFVFTQAMHHFGFVDVDDNIAHILRLEPDEYLRRLEQRS